MDMKDQSYKVQLQNHAQAATANLLMLRLKS